MPELLTERSGAVLTIRFDNPPHNLFPIDMLGDLRDLVRDAERDAGIRGVIFAGMDDGRWFTHLDPGAIAAQLRGAPRLSYRQARVAARLVESIRRRPRLERRLERSSLARGVLTSDHIDETQALMRQSAKVYVAAITGVCLGLGFILALACDYRLAAGEGVRLGLPEPVLGMLPSGVAAPLVRMVGTATAFDLLAQGRTMAPEEAASLGLLHRVVAPAEIEGEAAQLIATVARRPPALVREIKRGLHHGATLDDRSYRRVGLASLLSTISDPRVREALNRLDEDLQAARGPEGVVAAWEAATRRDV